MRLGVNIDHVATIRQARRGRLPDPVEAALACQRAGASSIVCHLREDRRHIQDDDVRRLKRALRAPLNLEMSIAEETGNEELKEALQAAQENAMTSASHLTASLGPIGALLGMVEPIMGLAGLQPFKLPDVGSAADPAALKSVLDAMKGAIDALGSVTQALGGCS